MKEKIGTSQMMEELSEDRANEKVSMLEKTGEELKKRASQGSCWFHLPSRLQNLTGYKKQEVYVSLSLLIREWEKKVYERR